jgi:hypothetical protein
MRLSLKAVDCAFSLPLPLAEGPEGPVASEPCAVILLAATAS